MTDGLISHDSEKNILDHIFPLCVRHLDENHDIFIRLRWLMYANELKKGRYIYIEREMFCISCPTGVRRGKYIKLTGGVH